MMLNEKRTRANMEIALEHVCRSLPHGGDHESRAFVARRLAEAALVGKTTLGELAIVGRKAFADYTVASPGHTDTSS
jgi:hypothetical protein